MTYDTDVYEITVAITLSEDNKLVTSLTMDGKTVDELKATFRNTYDSDVPPGPVTGDRSNLKFWIILFIISATMLVTLIVYDIYDRKKAK